LKDFVGKLFVPFGFGGCVFSDNQYMRRVGKVIKIFFFIFLFSNAAVNVSFSDKDHDKEEGLLRSLSRRHLCIECGTLRAKSEVE